MTEVPTDNLTAEQRLMALEHEMKQVRRFRKGRWVLYVVLVWLANEVYDWIDIDEGALIDRAQGVAAFVAIVIGIILNADKLRGLFLKD